jgi:hypothetical protein
MKAKKKASNTICIGERNKYACTLIHILYTLRLDEISLDRND